MKKIIFVFIIGVCLASCATKKKIIPRAINTVNSATLKELNLDREDYEILNTITAEATIAYRQRGEGYEITSRDDDFSITLQQGKTGPVYTYTGILKLGYLTNDYVDLSASLQPEQIARGLAIYRAINIVKEYGADAVIEPVISTNVEQIGKEIIFKSTVTAKLIKLKTNN